MNRRYAPTNQRRKTAEKAGPEIRIEDGIKNILQNWGFEEMVE